MPEIVKGSFVMCFGQKVGKVTEARIMVEPDLEKPSAPEKQFLAIETTIPHKDRPPTA
jgi:hypothetical protein